MSNDRAVHDFEAAIAGYPSSMMATLTYIARIASPSSHIIKARLNFHGFSSETSPKLFVSDQVIAQRFALSDLGISPSNVIKDALEGTIKTPQGEFALLPQSTGGFAATFIPLHPEVLAQQTRTGVLQIRGSDQTDHWQNPILDWSLRSAISPYDNLNELSIDFGIGAIIERSAIFEAVASSIVVVDLSSQINGEAANVGVLATKGLDRTQITIGYRVIDKNNVVIRDTIRGDELNWIEEATRDIGSCDIRVPPASVVNCYARYKGITYHSGFIVDPSLAQNPRRSAYERFDPELRVLTDLLNTKDKRYSRDLESAVACLLWMLGFNTCHLGGTKVLQDGPDIVGMTSEGHFIIVECTIGMLKADSKMPKLLSRTFAVRDQLAKSGHTHLRVIPVMVTTLSRAEIASDSGDAASNGVLVISGDDFHEAIGRTLAPPNSNRIFAEAEQALQNLVTNPF